MVSHCAAHTYRHIPETSTTSLLPLFSRRQVAASTGCTSTMRLPGTVLLTVKNRLVSVAVLHRVVRLTRGSTVTSGLGWIVTVVVDDTTSKQSVPVVWLATTTTEKSSGHAAPVRVQDTGTVVFSVGTPTSHKPQIYHVSKKTQQQHGVSSQFDYYSSFILLIISMTNTALCSCRCRSVYQGSASLAGSVIACTHGMCIPTMFCTVLSLPRAHCETNARWLAVSVISKYV